VRRRFRCFPRCGCPQIVAVAISGSFAIGLCGQEAMKDGRGSEHFAIDSKRRSTDCGNEPRRAVVEAGPSSRYFRGPLLTAPRRPCRNEPNARPRRPHAREIDYLLDSIHKIFAFGNTSKAYVTTGNRPAHRLRALHQCIPSGRARFQFHGAAVDAQ